MARVQVWGYQCERCQHIWVPRVSSGDELPAVCPKCKSPYWNKPRQTKKGGKKA